MLFFPQGPYFIQCTEQMVLRENRACAVKEAVVYKTPALFVAEIERCIVNEIREGRKRKDSLL